MDNRSKIEKLRMAGMQAAKDGNQKQADAATQKLQQIEPQWSETLDMIQEGIELATTNENGERDQQKYGVLMRQARACSCEPTRSGRCR